MKRTETKITTFDLGCYDGYVTLEHRQGLVPTASITLRGIPVVNSTAFFATLTRESVRELQEVLKIVEEAIR